jgi:copper transport protein
MTTESMSALLTALRVIGYAGFVLWAGPLIFWSLVGPAGQRHRRLVRLSGVGAVLLVLTSVAEPALRLTAGGQTLDEVAPPLAGAAVLLRLAILVASLFYLTDLVAGTVVGTRRAVALGSIVLVATTMALQPTVLGQPSPVLAAFGTAGHLLATAAWLGGLVALASVVRPGAQAGEAGGLVTRFSPVATLGLLLLVAASTLTVLAAAAGRAGLGGRLGARWSFRFVLLGVLLWSPGTPIGSPPGWPFAGSSARWPRPARARERALTLVVGTQLAIAFGTRARPCWSA